MPDVMIPVLRFGGIIRKAALSVYSEGVERAGGWCPNKRQGHLT
jgi:hypothetical protein